MTLDSIRKAPLNGNAIGNAIGDAIGNIVANIVGKRGKTGYFLRHGENQLPGGESAD